MTPARSSLLPLGFQDFPALSWLFLIQYCLTLMCYIADAISSFSESCSVLQKSPLCGDNTSLECLPETPKSTAALQRQSIQRLRGLFPPLCSPWSHFTYNLLLLLANRTQTNLGLFGVQNVSIRAHLLFKACFTRHQGALKTKTERERIGAGL